MAAVTPVRSRTMPGWKNTYIADENSLASLCSGCGIVCERVGRSSGRSSIETASWAAIPSTTTEATTAAKTTAEATATSKAAACPEASSEATTTAKASAATEAGSRAREAILSDLERTALPVVAIKLLDGVPGIIWGLKGNNTRAFGASIGSNVDVSANDGAISC
jgi:hypothetical protein